MAQAKIRSFYRAFIFEYYEVPAVADISSDDAWTSPAFLVGGRRRNTAVAAARSNYRQSANVLLPAAYTTHPSDRRRVLLCALRARALDVRIPGTRSVSDHAAAGMGILFAGRLSALGCGGAYTLSIVPLVCGVEAAPQRRLA